MIAGITLCVALGFIYRELASPNSLKQSTQLWFYDLNTGKLFPAPLDSTPPISAPSGPQPDGAAAGVLAHVYGCLSCAEADRRVAYLKTRTPAAREWARQARALQSASPEQLAKMSIPPSGTGVFVKRPNDSQQGRRI